MFCHSSCDICGTSSVNNQIILFYVNDSYFYYCALSYMEERYIQPFILKAGESGNYHTNDNGPNAKLKSHYNYSKESWILKYRMTIFFLATWIQYWWMHGTPLSYLPETSSGTVCKNKADPPHPSVLPNLPPTPRHVLPLYKSIMVPRMKKSMG